jgi:arabinofuranosyltransferase
MLGVDARESRSSRRPGLVSASRARPLGLADAGVLLLLLVGLAVYVRTTVSLGGRPEEDAAMLLRYAQHLAAGHGIVWNIGEPPVDGATDFLFLVAVALLNRLGLGLETAAQAIGLASHALTVAGVYLGPRVLFGASPLLCIPGAVFVAAGPGLCHVAADYGTPFFALWALAAFLLAARLARAEGTELRRGALLFALAGLVLGLARPEGVFLAVFLLAAVLYVRGGAGGGTVVLAFLGVFLTLGLAYFAWRWHYFGHPLPNPFYKKGGGVLHLHSLRMAWRDLWQLGLPFLVVLPVGLFVRGARRWAVFTLAPALLFVGLWILISNETNYVARFRYPILPAILVGWVPVALAIGGGPGARLRWPRALAWALALGAAFSLGVWQHVRYRAIVPRRMGLLDAALVLRDYARYNYALATTEAGLLPLYSTWRTVDAWGLNDAFIAHHGGVTAAYLDRYRPEVIVFHAYFSPGTAQEGPRIEHRSLGPAWYRMVKTLQSYAQDHGYVLAAVFGRDAWDTHWYFVRPGVPHADEIAARIRGLDYYWDGQPTVDLAAAPADR